jgi:SAM-dependent methyltransferase
LSAAPSPWLLRWPDALRPGASALDLACGSGRHVRHLAALGLRVTAVDRDAAALAPLASLAETLVADLEAGPWPLGERRFDLVLVTNYLWRPLLPHLVAALAPGGWLVYETFTQGQQSIGRPANPDFLLRPGELLQACAPLRIVGFEDGYEEGVNPRYVQRVAAVREAPEPGVFQRYRLD